MKNRARILAGVVLLLVGLSGAVWGARAALAQFMYCQSKFGRLRHDPDLVFALCKRASRLYPIDYYFCMWTAEKAYYSSLEPGLHRLWRDGRRQVAREWCERGLKLNFYKSPLRLLNTRLLAEDSLEDAIDYWHGFVEWQFWNPYNHAVMAELHARNGDRLRAEQELEWVKGSEFYREYAAKVKAALAEHTDAAAGRG
jgi:hypothetical protein